MRNAGVIVADEDGKEYFLWPTNLMGKARMEVQLEPEGVTGDNLLIRQFGYTLIFVGLVMYTILFLFRYLKRLLMLAFLTVIAPFVAMTYPLDKMNDGNAQAFNMWLKEYLFNLLIQPVHLILYTILIGSAIDFAADNLLYALAVFGFMLQAEKIMRRFFGFDKASTLEGGSALGGALAMQGINQLRRLTGKNKKTKGGNPNVAESKNKIPFRAANSGNAVNDLIDSEYGNPVLSAATVGNLTSGRGTTGTSVHGGTAMGSATTGAATDGTVVPSGSAVENPTLGASTLGGITTGGSTTGNTTATANRKTHRIKGVLKTMGSGVRYVAPKAARLALKATVAGAAGMAGMAAGLVSDDYSNVFKYGAAGLGAGWIAGGGIASIPGRLNTLGQRAGEGITNATNNAMVEYARTAYGEDAAKERRRQIEDMQANFNRERTELYQSKLGISGLHQTREVLSDAQKYKDSGIGDDELIIKAMKSKQFDGDRADRKRIILAGLAQEVGTDKKELDRMKKGLENKGVPEDEIAKYIEAIKEMNNWSY